MAKQSSSEIVSEEADYQKRFEKLEKDTADSKGLLDKIAEKVLGTVPPEKKENEKPETKPPAKPNSLKGIFQEIGILSKE